MHAVGRTVDISNSFELKYERDAQGVVQIDMPFTLHKQEQCSCYAVTYAPPLSWH